MVNIHRLCYEEKLLCKGHPFLLCIAAKIRVPEEMYRTHIKLVKAYYKNKTRLIAFVPYLGIMEKLI